MRELSTIKSSLSHIFTYFILAFFATYLYCCSDLKKEALMRAEQDIEKKIKQKEDEVQKLREDLGKAEAYIEALKESLRLIKKTSDPNEGIRPGSMMYKVRSALRKEGKSLYVEELLKRMGMEVNKKNKVSLSGSLGSYVRQEIIFTRPAPNTFGLIEFDRLAESQDDIPDGFGAG